MSDMSKNLEELNFNIEKSKNYFLESIKDMESAVQIYTHIDADGLTSGAILGKALYREKIPFQIAVLKQLEREEILKIRDKEFNNFIIFSDFGSGQYLELKDKLKKNGGIAPFLILDHHLPQRVASKDKLISLKEIYQETQPWHINPYFYGIDGSIEISSAGICYYFAKCLNEKNIDLAPAAIIGAIGDIQNKGPNKSFLGLNSLIIEDARNNNLIEIIDDLNFSSIKPLNEAIAYSSEIILPGLTKDINKTLKFLQTLDFLIENSEGNIRTLNNLNQDEKQKLSSAIIEYATLKLGIEPSKIIDKLIIKRYLIKNDFGYSNLYDSNEFSNILNACGRTNNASLGIAVTMGDRKTFYQQIQDIVKKYRSSIFQSLLWIKENEKIQQKDYIQYFFGEDFIPENIIGTIASILIFNKSELIDLSKPIFGIATRKDDDVYKISGRAHEDLVNKGVNLSEAIRLALELANLDSLGGGHPPAAGTKVPIEKIDIFLEKCNEVIKSQLEGKI